MLCHAFNFWQFQNLIQVKWKILGELFSERNAFLQIQEQVQSGKSEMLL
jgi:hypothetical protein